MSRVVPQAFNKRRDPLATSGSFGNAHPLIFHTQTFTIFRPWQACSACRHMLEAEEIVLPPDGGDYSCPHIQVADYEALLNKVLAGKYLLFGRETYTHMDTATQYIRVEWAEKDEVAIERLERERKKKEADVGGTPAS